ncbi:RNA 2',3'-cyclic phosphodiesterase [Paenibacillus sp. NEAU-GSW1]|uniref:RNA 2',3'-cyclic phosphodiesterase n=1 Tax=Paenibacillus sp. NEAU-GSW1 TaxID=2682486 RepID=UPI0012E21E9E|nr:RNA 2',3'-cyclic phosphodiesterase [Paenibacillus sp. NEAU-GSW1]MUT68239.1 RNA 2',3'-cyclic phosphodiesterase [Paenibacillus sp. NEAU-GSW1]
MLSSRVFIALPVTGPAAEQLNQWVQAQREKLSFRKWTHPLDYHITLQFLGETPKERIAELHDALTKVQYKPVTLALNGGGIFGLPKAPRILHAVISGDREGLTALHSNIVQATKPLGFIAEDRPFTPHVTLARKFAGAERVPFSVESMESMPANVIWEADRFVLMATHMHREPMYETLFEYRL